MTPARQPGRRSVLARPGYPRWFAAQTISRWGDMVNTVALVVLVFGRRPALVFGPYLLRALVDLILATTRNLPAAMVALGLAGESCSST